MTYLDALILGIVQGITEFFPISSSAHLKIFKKILEIPDGEHLIYFDLLCHLGTLIALVFYLRKEVLALLCDVRKWVPFLVALFPLIPAYFLLKPVRVFLSTPAYLGFFLIATAGMLYWVSRQKREMEQKPRGGFFWIGCAQACALVPGISRSGSTIAMARFCGWNLVDGAKFSYLLAIPAVLGGEILETYKWVSGHVLLPLPWECYCIGFVSSLTVGLFSVRAVFWIYEKGMIYPLAMYCLLLGIFALALFHG